MLPIVINIHELIMFALIQHIFDARRPTLFIFLFRFRFKIWMRFECFGFSYLIEIDFRVFLMVGVCPFSPFDKSIPKYHFVYGKWALGPICDIKWVYCRLYIVYVYRSFNTLNHEFKSNVVSIFRYKFFNSHLRRWTMHCWYIAGIQKIDLFYVPDERKSIFTIFNTKLKVINRNLIRSSPFLKDFLTFYKFYFSFGNAQWVLSVFYGRSNKLPVESLFNFQMSWHKKLSI